jgi:hypothetical protein
LLIFGRAEENGLKTQTSNDHPAKERRSKMRPPSKRGTAVIPADQQRTNSIFKMSLRSWQAQYKAQQTGRNGDDGKSAARSERN